jgi:HEAT repeat protein
MTNIDIDFRNQNNKERSELIEKLHEVYYSSEKEERIKILQKLNYLNDAKHFDQIESYFISDENPEVRLEAAKVLAFNYEKPEAIEPIIWVLKNERDKSLKITAVRLLVSIVELHEKFRNEIIDILETLLKSRDIKLKLEAIESLTILNDKSIVNELINLTNSKNRLVKNRAIQALGDLGSDKAVPYLIKGLGVDSYDVWKFTFNSLRKLIPDELPKILINKLEKLNQQVDSFEKALFKKGIIKALGEIREDEKHEIYPILNCLNDKYYWVRHEAVDALDKIDPNWKKTYREYIGKNHLIRYL